MSISWTPPLNTFSNYCAMKSFMTWTPALCCHRSFSQSTSLSHMSGRRLWGVSQWCHFLTCCDPSPFRRDRRRQRQDDPGNDLDHHPSLRHPGHIRGRYALIHSFIHSFIYSLGHWLTHSCIHLLMNSLLFNNINSFIHPSIHSIILPPICSLFHWSSHSLIHSLMNS